MVSEEGGPGVLVLVLRTYFMGVYYVINRPTWSPMDQREERVLNQGLLVIQFCIPHAY